MSSMDRDYGGRQPVAQRSHAGWFWIAGIAAIVLMAGMWWMSTYNGLVSNKQVVDRTAGVVQAEYQRRYNLIPNLVKTVEAQANFERGALTDVISARSQVAKLNVSAADLNDPQKLQQFQQAQQQLSGALSRLMVVVEKYPDLKTNQGFHEIRVSLEGTENRIKTAISDNQMAVENYNRSAQGFLSSSVADHYRFPHELAYFKASEGAQQAPTVNFDIKK